MTHKIRFDIATSGPLLVVVAISRLVCRNLTRLPIIYVSFKLWCFVARLSRETTLKEWVGYVLGLSLLLACIGIRGAGL